MPPESVPFCLFRVRLATCGAKKRNCKTAIQRRLEIAFSLILQELSRFLIGILCRLEMTWAAAKICHAAPYDPYGSRGSQRTGALLK
jgi:hypothetical protein